MTCRFRKILDPGRLTACALFAPFLCILMPSSSFALRGAGLEENAQREEVAKLLDVPPNARASATSKPAIGLAAPQAEGARPGEEPTGRAGGLEEDVRKFDSVDKLLAFMRSERSRFMEAPVVVEENLQRARKWGAHVVDVPGVSLSRHPMLHLYVSPDWYGWVSGYFSITIGGEKWWGAKVTVTEYKDAREVIPHPHALVVRSATAAPVSGVPNLVLQEPDDLLLLTPVGAIAAAKIFDGELLPKIVTSILLYRDAKSYDRVVLFAEPESGSLETATPHLSLPAEGGLEEVVATGFLTGMEGRRLPVTVFKTAGDIGRAQMEEVMPLWARAVASQQPLVLGLPTGSTPLPFLQHMVSYLSGLAFEKRQQYLSQLYIVAMDDIVDQRTDTNVPPDHERSAYRFFQQHFFDHVKECSPEWVQTHLTVPTVGQVSQQVKTIQELGGVQWQLMATDPNEGHVAEVHAGDRFGDPVIRAQKGHARDLSPLFLQHNAWASGYRGITLTLDDFVEMLAPNGVVSFALFGEAKQGVLGRFANAGQYDPELPISFLWLPEWQAKGARVKLLADQTVAQPIVGRLGPREPRALVGQKRVVVIQNSAEPAGTFGDILERQGFPLQVIRADDPTQQDLIPHDPAALDWDNIAAVIVMGGPPNVYENKQYPWLDDLAAFIRTTVERQVPYLGICLGCQLLTRAVGGKVTPDPQAPRGVEKGYSRVALTPAGQQHPFFGGFRSQFHIAELHGDTIYFPQEARFQLADGTDVPVVQLAQGEVVPWQAFAVGTAIGVLGHPEAGPDVFDEWLKVPENADDAANIRRMQHLYQRNPAYQKRQQQVAQNWWKLVEQSWRQRSAAPRAEGGLEERETASSSKQGVRSEKLEVRDKREFSGRDGDVAFGVGQSPGAPARSRKQSELLTVQSTSHTSPLLGANTKANATQPAMEATNTIFARGNSLPNTSPANAPAKSILEKSANVLDSTARRPSLSSIPTTLSVLQTPFTVNAAPRAEGGLEENWLPSDVVFAELLTENALIYLRELEAILSPTDLAAQRRQEVISQLKTQEDTLATLETNPLLNADQRSKLRQSIRSQLRSLLDQQEAIQSETYERYQYVKATNDDPQSTELKRQLDGLRSKIEENIGFAPPDRRELLSLVDEATRRLADVKAIARERFLEANVRYALILRTLLRASSKEERRQILREVKRHRLPRGLLRAVRAWVVRLEAKEASESTEQSPERTDANLKAPQAEGGLEEEGEQRYAAGLEEDTSSSDPDREILLPRPGETVAGYITRLLNTYLVLANKTGSSKAVYLVLEGVVRYSNDFGGVDLDEWIIQEHHEFLNRLLREVHGGIADQPATEWVLPLGTAGFYSYRGKWMRNIWLRIKSRAGLEERFEKALHALTRKVGLEEGVRELNKFRDGETFGQYTQRLRKRNGWTQTQLAEGLGVTASFITKIEGDDALPSLQFVQGLAQFFGLNQAEAYVLRSTLMESKQQRAQQRYTARAKALKLLPQGSPEVSTSPTSLTGTDDTKAIDARILVLARDFLWRLRKEVQDPSVQQKFVDAINALGAAQEDSASLEPPATPQAEGGLEEVEIIPGDAIATHQTLASLGEQLPPNAAAAVLLGRKVLVYRSRAIADAVETVLAARAPKFAQVAFTPVNWIAGMNPSARAIIIYDSHSGEKPVAVPETAALVDLATLPEDPAEAFVAFIQKTLAAWTGLPVPTYEVLPLPDGGTAIFV